MPEKVDGEAKEVGGYNQGVKGYTNYETQVVLETIHSVPELDQLWQHYAEQAIKNGEWTMQRGNLSLEEAINYDLTELLRQHFTMIVERLELPWKSRGRITDGKIVSTIRDGELVMLRKILFNSKVNFSEIATKLIAEAKIRLEDAEAIDAVAEGRGE